MTIKELKRAIEILKLPDDHRIIGADHDVVYLVELDEVTLTDEESAELQALGWFAYDELSWAHYV